MYFDVKLGIAVSADMNLFHTAFDPDWDPYLSNNPLFWGDMVSPTFVLHPPPPPNRNGSFSFFFVNKNKIIKVAEVEYKKASNAVRDATRNYQTVFCDKVGDEITEAYRRGPGFF